MLQNNHLYRRIQHKNLFRTFSRTYSRQSQGRRLHSENRQLIHFQPNHSTSTPFIHSNPNQSPKQNKITTLQNTAKHLELTSQTAPIFKRNQGPNNIETPFSSTGHLSNFLPESTNLQKYSHNNYLNALLQKKKESGSTASHLSNLVRKQNFKLKSCSQAKQVCYETETDQTDFSILEYNKRFKIRKEMQQRQQRQTQNISRMELLKSRNKQPNIVDLKAYVGKRIAAHLFNRYNRTIQGFINISKKEDGTKSFNN